MILRKSINNIFQLYLYYTSDSPFETALLLLSYLWGRNILCRGKSKIVFLPGGKNVPRTVMAASDTSVMFMIVS